MSNRQPPFDAVTAAREIGGANTLLMLLLAQLRRHGLLDVNALAADIEQAERNTRGVAPCLAGSNVVLQTLAWLRDEGVSEPPRVAGWTPTIVSGGKP